jgi:hypothetical protein
MYLDIHYISIWIELLPLSNWSFFKFRSYVFKLFYPAISTFAVQICYANKFLLYSYQTNTFLYYTNKLFSLRINFLVPCSYVTAEGAEKYETGTNVTRTTKKTPLTTVMKGEEWRLFLFFLFKSDKFSDFFWHCRINTIYVYCR